MAFSASPQCLWPWVTLTKGSEMWPSLWSPLPNPSLSFSTTLKTLRFVFFAPGKINHKSYSVKKPERYKAFPYATVVYRKVINISISDHIYIPPSQLKL